MLMTGGGASLLLTFVESSKDVRPKLMGPRSDSAIDVLGPIAVLFQGGTVSKTPLAEARHRPVSVEAGLASPPSARRSHGK